MRTGGDSSASIGYEGALTLLDTFKQIFKIKTPPSSPTSHDTHRDPKIYSSNDEQEDVPAMPHKIEIFDRNETHHIEGNN